MSCDNQSLGIILVRSLRKVGAPFVEVSFEGTEISGKALKLKLRDVLRLLSANVEIRLFHLDNGREFSDHETAPTYTYLTYTLARTSARSGFHAGSEIPTHVAALLHNNDVSSFLPTSRTNVGSVSLSSNCSAESSEGNVRAPSGGSVAPTQRLKSVSDRLLLFGFPRKVLENFMQCKGDVASLCSHSADRTQLSQNDLLHCPLCSFSLHLPLRTPCCRAIACQPCLTYAQTNNLDPGMTECCPFCLALLDLKNVKTDPELLKQVQNLAKRQREDASHIDNRNSCEESSKISEETSLPRSAIISQSEFDLLRALEKEFILQKRKGTAVPNSEFTSEISLSREEVALAKRVQQSIASNGDIPMPFLTDAQRHRIEAHLALSSVGNSAPKK